MQRIEIWSPKYHGRKVLIAKYKVGVHNEIVFTKAKHLAGKTYYISGEDVEKYPLTTNGTISVYEVDMDALKLKEG